MKISLGFIAVWVAVAMGQSYPECTSTLARSDQCASVINANACYNKFRWNAQTLTCIDGTDAEKKKAVCQCCGCVGKVMCDWVTKQKYC